jgi:hypothetical protein
MQAGVEARSGGARRGRDRLGGRAPRRDRARHAPDALTRGHRALHAWRERRYLLVEFPYGGWPLDLEQRVFELVASGLTPVLAHPDRSRDVQDDPRRLERAVSGGRSYRPRLPRSTGGSAGTRRPPPRAWSSSGSSTSWRATPIRLTSERSGFRASKALGDDGLSRWLMEEVPAAILAGEDLPDRPTGRRRRFGFL